MTSEELLSIDTENTPHQLPKFSRVKPWLLGSLAGLLLLVVCGGMVFWLNFKDQIFPGVYVNNIHVGRLTQEEALQLLTQKLPPPTDSKITLAVEDIALSSTSAQLGLEPEYQRVVAQAYEVGRVGNVSDILSQLYLTFAKTIHLPLTYQLNPAAVTEFVSLFKEEVDIQGSTPSAELAVSGSVGSITINPGELGRELNLDQTVMLVLQHPTQTRFDELPIASTSAVLSPEEIETAREKSARFVGRRFIFTKDNVRMVLNDRLLISILAFPDGFRQDKLDEILNSWRDEVSRPAQNAVFNYDPNTLVVSEFQPARPGLTLNTSEVQRVVEVEMQKIIDETEPEKAALTYNDQNFDLPVIAAEPEISLADTNDLGIKEVIGVGESEYDHSTTNRIHNVALTTDRISNIIIPPGKEFSFNQALGEVSAATGFRSAYVIKSGKTELDDGGGVCQVSTTVFRAALDAGLEITRRLPHSYRVSYYELNSKPGIDATVYAGNVDLRFINDTDHHILLHGEANSRDLYMKIEIYGTSDGRTTQIVDHETWGYQPPPPPEYYPESSLPTGKTEQIDWAVAGIKAKFTHQVFDANGELMRENTYYSNYRPWSAKYLVGEG